MTEYDSKKNTVSALSQALFTVNKHAKTASDPKYLYKLKKEALSKLLQEDKARKIGLQFSRNPGMSQQRSDVLVECGEYLFHLPPKKEDFTTLPHLGKLSDTFRNPKTKMSLREAKTLLQSYTGLSDHQPPAPGKHRTYQKPVFKRLGE
ncbi:YkyB family protein [Jeotgalibacillus proteolyticus]|uniref:YkyB family protein n=1 Tax=Jeotgalibacillus proteolyticus TaxID=2082395 RepID=UPI003CF87472